MPLPQNEILIGHAQGGYSWRTIDTSSYPDGSPLIQYQWGYENANVMLLRPKTMETFVAAMFYCDAAEERGKPITTLILPHVPGGRQDRLNDSGDFLFTLKSVARMINDRGFDKVVVLDPHSNVTPALIDRCETVTLASLLKNFWKGYSGVIAPDAGAAKRAFEVAQVLESPFHQAEKHRDVTTGKLSGFAAPTIKYGEHYLVVDDICDGGGTFLGLADVIKKAGAYASLFVTHGIFSQGTEELLKCYKTITCTDSIVSDRNQMQVLTLPAVERLTR